jgi:FixJ family two-component response regulator
MGDTGALSADRQVIAIVDDELLILTSLKRLLEANKFFVKGFLSGEQFLESEEVADMACVILDINLSGMSGIETRRTLSSKGSTVPVIYMTALDTAAVRTEAIESGCAAYLQKPVSGCQLICAIRSATAEL